MTVFSHSVSYCVFVFHLCDYNHGVGWLTYLELLVQCIFYE